MTKKTLLALAACAVPAASFAQGSVTMFGLMDAGISYVSNQGGHGAAKFDDNIFFPNLLGFEGKEDLGAGTRAIFRLVNQYSLGNGSIIGGGLFARTAYVGLQNNRYGTLTLGNQYEFMVDALAASGNEIAQDLVGLYGFRNGPFDKLALPTNPTGAFDWDRVAGSNRVANSVKYTSPSLSGLTFGALYGFGNVAGSVGANNTVSVGASYDNGPFGAGAAYTNQKYGATDGLRPTSVRNWGAGVHYTLGTVTAKALFTTVRNAQNGAGAWSAEAGAAWRPSPAWVIGASYTYMKGNDTLDNAHAHQLLAAVQYWLSKRTMVYVAGVHQRATHGSNAQINGVMDANGASGGALQSIARVGFSTRF
ncbi:porin [Burkholderia contaminans]|uniref:porin n=1 Tax=Burkholderia contaminans TaxID=488447 RepID=UPI001CF0F6FC|nr:porin [Burkholderia contaminans]MCA7915978.1 porin [Burkholderia contaminans]UUX40625.1 porin [Burkholderia contaminans]